MKLLFYVTCMLTFSLLFIVIARSIRGGQSQVQRRVDVIIAKSKTTEHDAVIDEKEKKVTMQDRVMKPVWDKVKLSLFRKMPKEATKVLEKRLQDAGNPFHLTPADFQLTKVVFGSIFFFLIMFMFLPGSNEPGKVIVLAIVGGLFGALYPSFYINTKKKQRVIAIQKEMPDFFDMVNVSIEAGMGLDAALSKVSKQMNGPLSVEFVRTIDEMRLGKSRRQAFSDMRERIPSDSFQSVMSALIQADQLGLGMSKVLRAQTQRIREQSRQLASEQAMKAPVKMMIPMVLFIFPTLFIVLLGPIVVKAVTEWF